MNSLWTTLIWAVATVAIVGVLILRFGDPLVALIRAHQESVEAKKVVSEAAALKQQNEAEIERRTLDQLTELRKAELARKTTELELQTEAVRASSALLVQAEQQVVAARTQRRIQAAQEGPVNQPASPETMAALADGYQTFIAEWGSPMHFDAWLGSAEWTELDPGTVIPLIMAYKASCETESPTSFDLWMGKLKVRDGILTT